ncbi:MAG TPA: urease accessory protein UreD [Vicinamibacteria bacterium]|nr:urease accessory protein UreD [Vicinamibacteria bacterium]
MRRRPDERPDLTRVGRDGLLQLAFDRRGPQTVLTRRLFRTPLQFLEPIALGEDGSVCAVLLNPTGGVLGGDRLVTEVDLGPGTHVCVTTPSATRVHRSAGAPAVQQTRLTVGPGATLEYAPDHLIPHAGALLEQAVHVDLSSSGRLILWDAFAVGRVARGESWQFAALDSRLEIRREGRLLLADRLRLDGGPAPLDGGAVRLRGLGGTEGLGYVATLVAVDPAFSDWEAVAGELETALGPEPPWRAGASPLAAGGCFVRCLAESAHELADQRKALWSLLRRRLLGRAELDLRKH